MGSHRVAEHEAEQERRTSEAMSCEEKAEFKRVCGRSGRRQAGGLAGRRGQAGCAHPPILGGRPGRFRRASLRKQTHCPNSVHPRGSWDTEGKVLQNLVLLKLDSFCCGPWGDWLR